MVDLQAISSTAPTSDILAALAVMAMGVVGANLAVVPRLLRHDAGSARTLLGVDVLGLVAALVILAVEPSLVFAGMLVYAVAFTGAGLRSSWRALGGGQATVRTAGAVACMLVALAAAYAVVHVPR